ncbi:MAG: glutathione S-transferase N-terminal domain-containing protein [Chlamydiales bacterium]|nr:glutathione S-transferase N-terminal domain-containing protein [Chlamydiales bacterium]
MFVCLFKNNNNKITFCFYFLFFVSSLYANEFDLALYYRPNCFYCTKVLDVIKKDTITQIEMKNISTNPQYITQLVQVGGKKQVPCLVINGKAMYESDTIINWLDKHKDQLQ